MAIGKTTYLKTGGIRTRYHFYGTKYRVQLTSDTMADGDHYTVDVLLVSQPASTPYASGTRVYEGDSFDEAIRYRAMYVGKTDEA